MVLQDTDLIRRKKFSNTAKKVFKEFSSLNDEALRVYAVGLLEEDPTVTDDYACKEILCLYESMVRKEMGLSTPGFYNGESINFDSHEEIKIDQIKEHKIELPSLPEISFDLIESTIPSLPSIEDIPKDIKYIKEEVMRDIKDQSFEETPSFVVEEKTIKTDTKLDLNFDMDFSTSFDDYLKEI